MTLPISSSRPSKFSNAQTVLYEIDMFRFAAESFTNEDGAKEWRNLECFLLHFRNLIEFFGGTPKGDDLSITRPDAIWETHIPDEAKLKQLHRPDLWKKYEMPQADDPSKPNIKISRYLHHCTRQRVDPTSWRVAEMFAEIAPVLSLFEDLVAHVNRPWKRILHPQKLEYLPKTSCTTASPSVIDVFDPIFRWKPD